MSIVTIYGMPQSRAARVLWMARELGVEHVNDPVHFQKTRESSALAGANPNQRIPALVDGNFWRRSTAPAPGSRRRRWSMRRWSRSGVSGR